MIHQAFIVLITLCIIYASINILCLLGLNKLIKPHQKNLTTWLNKRPLLTRCFIGLNDNSVAYKQLKRLMQMGLALIGFALLCLLRNNANMLMANHAIYLWLQHHQSIPLTHILLGITAYDPYVIKPLLALWMAYCLLRKEYKCALTVLSLAGLIFVSLHFFKFYFMFPRPPFAALVGILTVHAPSFPSGHSTIAAATIGFWGWQNYACLSKYTNRMVTIIASTLVLLIMFSRIYLGVHWLNDIMAGFLLGFTLCKIAHYMLNLSPHPIVNNRNDLALLATISAAAWILIACMTQPNPNYFKQKIIPVSFAQWQSQQFNTHQIKSHPPLMTPINIQWLGKRSAIDTWLTQHQWQRSSELKKKFIPPPSPSGQKTYLKHIGKTTWRLTLWPSQYQVHHDTLFMGYLYTPEPQHPSKQKQHTHTRLSLTPLSQIQDNWHIKKINRPPKTLLVSAKKNKLT